MDAEDYKKLIAEIIQKQIDIIGSDIAVQKAKNVEGLEISDTGEVLGLSGDPPSVLQKLVDEYIALSGQIVKNVLSPVFAKYPEINFNLK